MSLVKILSINVVNATHLLYTMTIYPTNFRDNLFIFWYIESLYI